MRKNIKGIAAGSLGLLALQLPGMTVFAQAADRKARLANALQNTVLGMGTVFIMLIAIALIIYCFKIIPVIQKKFAKKSRTGSRGTKGSTCCSSSGTGNRRSGAGCCYRSRDRSK